VAMAVFYIGTWNAVYTTTYGVMVVAKIYLVVAIAALGAGNWFLVRHLARDPKPLLSRLRRVAEAEICLGFAAVLTAASLTAQAPAIDVTAQDRLTSQEIYARMHPVPPRMTSPPLAALAPPISLGGPDRACRRSAGAAQPSPNHAVGSLLASDLRWFSRIHPPARRPGKLAPRATSLLAKFHSARNRATSFRSALNRSLRGLRMRRAGRQVEGEVGQLRLSCNVCSRRRDLTYTRARRQGKRSAARRDEPHPYRAPRRFSRLYPMARAPSPQKPYDHHRRLPLAAVPRPRRLNPPELSRIGITKNSNLKLCSFDEPDTHHFPSGCSETLRVFPSGSLNQATLAPVGEVQISESSCFKNS
jgi:Copper resistance protein D